MAKDDKKAEGEQPTDKQIAEDRREADMRAAQDQQQEELKHDAAMAQGLPGEPRGPDGNPPYPAVAQAEDVRYREQPNMQQSVVERTGAGANVDTEALNHRVSHLDMTQNQRMARIEHAAQMLMEVMVEMGAWAAPSTWYSTAAYAKLKHAAHHIMPMTSEEEMRHVDDAVRPADDMQAASDRHVPRYDTRPVGAPEGQAHKSAGKE
jgi:hypothetical protein